MPSQSPIVRQLLRIGPHDGAHRVAARAALSVGAPLVLLLALGRSEWTIYAAFGAFTSLYGRGISGAERLRMQSAVGGLLVFSVVAGVATGISPNRAWWSVPATAVVAGLGAAMSDRQGWHPPGPLFLVFGFAACASIPSGGDDLLPALLVSGGTAVFSIVVGSSGSLWRRAGGGGSIGGQPAQARRTGPAPVEHRHVWRAVVGVAVAGSIATAAGIGHPYWAMVSAVVPLVARQFDGQLVRAVHRVVGTGLGLLLAGLLLWLDLPTAVLVLVVIALQAAAELLVGRNYAIALIAVTPLALLMLALVRPIPTEVLLRDRAVETMIGVAIGLLIGWLTRRRR